MMGPMLIVKYRNSSSYRLMSQSDDSPFRFSAYLPYLREFESYVNDAAENGVLEYQFRVTKCFLDSSILLLRSINSINNTKSLSFPVSTKRTHKTVPVWEVAAKQTQK